MVNQVIGPKNSHPTVTSAWIALIISFVILGLKFGAYTLTHSQAVFSDAVESIVNVVTAIIALIVMKIVAEPADERHPYGHGKLEYFSSAFEGGMIAFAAIAIGYEAIRALIEGIELHELETGMIIVAISAVANLLLGLHLKNTGKKFNSEALLGSGAHVLADVWTTVAVIAGLVLVKFTGWQWLDPCVALLAAFMLGTSGYKIVRRAAGALIDEIDHKVLGHLCRAMNQHRKPGLINVHDTRVIRSGKFHHVDAHLVVPNFWDALKVHSEAHEFEEKVVSTYPYDGELAFHVDPCRQEFCSICDLSECPIRKETFTGLQKMTVKSVIKGYRQGLHE
jgi:cation diffusion facilitator family transporter